MASFPDQDWCMTIHRLLVGGDPTAQAELIRAVHPALVGWLHAKRRTTNRELIRDAATDAMVDYIKNPTKWNPDRSTLVSYICMAADRDLLNAVEKSKRLYKREILVPDVEDRHMERNVPAEDEGRSDVTQGLLDALDRHVTSRSDREFLTLMLTGERSTDRFAALLGIGNLPRQEQARVVKQHKDRLKKVVQRLRRRRDARAE